jgi:hypothetical protein
MKMFHQQNSRESKVTKDSIRTHDTKCQRDMEEQTEMIEKECSFLPLTLNN